jgi:DNA polymerase III epsilon subunit-like protein
MYCDCLPGENLLRNKYNQRYLFWDCETVNVNLVDKKNLPWNIGGLLTQGEKVLKSFDWYPYFPGLEMREEAILINGFDPVVYKKKGRPPEEVWEEFSSIFYDPEIILVGHNILNLDINAINNYRNWLGLKKDFSYVRPCRIIDTNCLAKAHAKGFKAPSIVTDGDNFMFWQFQLVEFHERSLKTNLQHMAKTLDIEVDESKLHQGSYDAVLNKEVYFKLIKTMGI